jgi:hypothetical protein
VDDDPIFAAGHRDALSDHKGMNYLHRFVKKKY